MKHINCEICSRYLTNDEIAFNLRLFGRGLSRFKCIRCLSLFFDSTEESLRESMEMYKQNGCELFSHKYVSEVI